MSFNKYKNVFKGMSNVIEATSKEEQIHGLFGTELINIMRKEHPEWFDDQLECLVIQACKEAYKSEELVIDWIYESGDLDFLPKSTVKEFVKNRLNNSLKGIGYSPIFEVDKTAVEETDWFDDEVVATKHVDFFVKRSINYSKRTQSITGDDLF
jgi:ribonucleoside-diphosphate reductase beta chain